jgi:hypothetical protein
MCVSLKWTADLTSGYDHLFLSEANRILSISFSTVDNPSIGAALRLRPMLSWLQATLTKLLFVLCYDHTFTMFRS